MNAGRPLDALVAERVMGLMAHRITVNEALHLMTNGPRPGEPVPVRFYSTDIAAAWEVVEKLHLCELGMLVDGEGSASWRCVFGGPAFAEAHTAPLAICLAALKAVGVEVPPTNPSR